MDQAALQKAVNDRDWVLRIVERISDPTVTLPPGSDFDAGDIDELMRTVKRLQQIIDEYEAGKNG